MNNYREAVIADIMNVAKKHTVKDVRFPNANNGHGRLIMTKAKLKQQQRKGKLAVKAY